MRPESGLARRREQGILTPTDFLRLFVLHHPVRPDWKAVWPRRGNQNARASGESRLMSAINGDFLPLDTVNLLMQ